MKLTLKLFATLADHLPAGARGNATELEFDAAPSVASLIDAYNLPPRLVHLVLVNGNFVGPEARAARLLEDGDTLAIWPPIAGG